MAEGCARRITYLRCIQKCGVHLDPEADAVPGAAAGRPGRAGVDILRVVLVTSSDRDSGGALRGGQPKEPQEVRLAREMRGMRETFTDMT